LVPVPLLQLSCRQFAVRSCTLPTVTVFWSKPFNFCLHRQYCQIVTLSQAQVEQSRGKGKAGVERKTPAFPDWRLSACRTRGPGGRSIAAGVGVAQRRVAGRIEDLAGANRFSQLRLNLGAGFASGLRGG